MKQKLLKSILLLCALVVGNGSLRAADAWVKTDPTALSSGDIVVIVDLTSSKAMSNNNGTSSAPSATAVTLNTDKDEITSEVGTEIQWTVKASGSGSSRKYEFAKGDDYLYTTSSNNGVRVGSNANNTFTFINDENSSANNSSLYLKNSATSRFLGVYNKQDWRCYTSVNSNIQETETAFFKKITVSGAVDPSVNISSTKIVIGSTATISGPDGLTITYESDDESVATVSDEGVVTGIASGSATITATWAAVADTYNAGSQDFTVNVVNATVYEKVTSANQLVVGNQYLLVATGNNMVMGAENTKKRANVAMTINDNKVAVVDEAVAVLTLGGVENAWTFLASDNDEYLAYSGNSNELHTNADGTANASKWIVTNDFQLESANVSGRVLKYNSGSPRFACYTSGQQTAVLFVKSGSKVKTTLTLASACTDGAKYYGTYSNSKAFIVPEDLTVSAITVADGKLTVTDYAAGDVVKANTGVMVSATSAGEKTVVLTAETGTEKDGNMLKASGDAGIDAATMDAADTKFYRLTMHNGTQIGFWWGAENGAAFALAANKAYLAVPSSALAASREGLWLDLGGETTGVSEKVAVNSEKSATAPVYNLNGQRVSQPTRGLYIVNGKKVVVK